MTRVIVAASIDNELTSENITAVKKLQKAGYDVRLYYYLRRVPPEFSMIPSFNKELVGWRTHATKMLSELGDKLAIPAGNRHFVDEVLGPDQVFDEAKELQADIIITNDKNQLKQSFLSKVYDQAGAFFKGTKSKDIPVENVGTFEMKELGSPGKTRIEKKIEKESETYDEKVHPSIWTKKSQQDLKSAKEEKIKKDQDEVTQEESTYNIKRK